MGSDAPPSAWLLVDGQLDYSLINRVVLAIMGALTAGGRAAAAVALGQRWAALSDGVFDESIMPALLAAAPRAGEDVQPFAAALARVRRQRPTTPPGLIYLTSKNTPSKS